VLYGDNLYTGLTFNRVSQLVFALLADHTGRAIENAHKFEQMARQARTDALTGLAHHGTLMEELCHAAERALSTGQPLGFLMVDLDDFKQVNDSHGHLTGDALLAGVAIRMRSVLRASESPYRYGGEEFAVLLPGADREAALVVGERLRRAVSGQPFNVGSGAGLRVTCSVGVASMPEDGNTAKVLVAAADEALLRAKAQGKNKVVVAPGTSRPENDVKMH
jgi:diguanylate cyclase (GGDEF)-like protein